MNNLSNTIDLLKCFPRESLFYWIEVLVKQGAINKGQAGFLLNYFKV